MGHPTRSSAYICVRVPALYARACTHMCTCLHTRTICMCLHTHVHMPAHTSTCLHTHVHMPAHALRQLTELPLWMRAASHPSGMKSQRGFRKRRRASRAWCRPRTPRHPVVSDLSHTAPLPLQIARGTCSPCCPRTPPTCMYVRMYVRTCVRMYVCEVHVALAAPGRPPPACMCACMYVRVCVCTCVRYM